MPSTTIPARSAAVRELAACSSGHFDSRRGSSSVGDRLDPDANAFRSSPTGGVSPNVAVLTLAHFWREKFGALRLGAAGGAFCSDVIGRSGSGSASGREKLRRRESDSGGPGGVRLIFCAPRPTDELFRPLRSLQQPVHRIRGTGHARALLLCPGIACARLPRALGAKGSSGDCFSFS